MKKHMVWARRMLTTYLIPVCLLAGAISWANTAVAQEKPTLSGRWQAGPLIARWRIGEWGDACGPRPGGGGSGGAQVTIKQAGKELTIVGGGRTYSTTQCWQQQPGVRRTSHSATGRFWQNVCKSPLHDPRQTTLRTKISATDNSIAFEETGQYQFVIKGQNCTASSGHWRSYKLIQREGEAERVSETKPSTPEQEPAAEPGAADEGEHCQEPGAPARLEVRPARKLMLAGEEFRFRTRVLDAQGCRVSAPVVFTLLEPNDAVEIVPGGSVRIAEDAKEGEVALHASVGDQSVRIDIDIASRERYEALLESGTFNQAGESEHFASVAIASQAVGADTAVAENRAESRKNLFVLLVAAIAVLLGLGGTIVVMRARRRRRQELQQNQQAHEEAVAEYERARRQAEERRADYEAKRQAEQDTREKICPLCGKVYPPNTAFCGEDGASLLPVN